MDRNLPGLPTGMQRQLGDPLLSFHSVLMLQHGGLLCGLGSASQNLELPGRGQRIGCRRAGLRHPVPHPLPHLITFHD